MKKLSLKKLLVENEDRRRRENVKRKFDALHTMDTIRKSPKYQDQVSKIPQKKRNITDLMASDAIKIIRAGMAQYEGNPEEAQKYLLLMLKRLPGVNQYTAAAKKIIEDYIQAELSGF